MPLPTSHQPSLAEQELFGRQLLSSVSNNLLQHCHQPSAKDSPTSAFANGLCTGLFLLAKSYPFTASSLSHFHLAESILCLFLKLTDNNQALEEVKASLSSLKEHLYADHLHNKGHGRPN